MTLNAAAQLQNAFDRQDRKRACAVRSTPGGIGSGFAARSQDGSAPARPAAWQPAPALVLDPEAWRELVEQASGKISRQVMQLLAEVDPELAAPADRVRPWAGATLGQIMGRLVQGGLDRHDPARPPRGRRTARAKGVEQTSAAKTKTLRLGRQAAPPRTPAPDSLAIPLAWRTSSCYHLTAWEGFVAMIRSTLAPAAIEYPTEDGVPLAETDAQGIPLIYAVAGLRDYFRHRPDVYVSGNLLIYYQEGNFDASVAPDVFVVFGVPNHIRPTYKAWEEGKSPDFVMEITSRHTRHNDQGPKRELYESLGVQEYWQYDPTGDYLEPPLRGLSLVGGEYEELAETRLGDGTLAIYSAVLGLEVWIEEGELRFHDPETGRNIRTLTESNEAWQRAELAWQQAEQERQQERQARQQAEQERQQERQARQQAERDRQQAEAARDAAEAQVAELRALLARRHDPGADSGAGR